MQSQSTGSAGFAGGLWLTVIGIFIGLGFAGGYLVAANHASTGLRHKEAEWSTKARTFMSQENKLAVELAALKEALSAKDAELAAVTKRQAEMKAMLNLDRNQSTLVRSFERAKQGFSNIKVELNAGHFKGLEETDGFQILSAAFETSAVAPEN